MPAFKPDDTTTDKTRARAGNSGDAIDQKKLVPPPPIIGPDGKEIPRPKDAAGRPLPVYVTSEGKAILDENGSPIPLCFGENGKPIPLDALKGKGAHSKRQNQGGNQEIVVVARRGSAEKVPNWIKWMGVVDIVIGIAVGLFYVYETSEAVKNKQPTTWHLFITTVFIFAGVLSGGILIIAERKNKTKFVWIWACVILLLTVIQIGTCIPLGLKNSTMGALAYYIVRLIVALCTGCIVSTDPDSPISTQNRDNRYYTTVAGAKGYPTRGVQTVNVGAPQTIVVQQPGYYPSYGRYGYDPYYGSATDAALLGFAAGSMMGGGFYGGYGWGGYDYFDDGYYDGFGW